MFNSIHAVIFDLDDTLIASAPAWKTAETTLLDAIGQAWDPLLAARYKGMNALDVSRVIHQHWQPARSLQECQQIMRNTLIRQFAEVPLLPMPGAEETVRRLHARYVLAVASGSPLPAIQAALSRLGILDLFTVVVSSESVNAGKPAPDVFLRALELLGKTRENCVIVEDTAIGAAAAIAAGMDCYLIPSNPDARLVSHPKVRMVSSLLDVLPQ